MIDDIAWLDRWYYEQVLEFHKAQSLNFNYQLFQKRTDRAKAPLIHTDDLLAYNALYGASHIARLRKLLAGFGVGFKLYGIPSPLRVFDYGCGQGLASLTLLESLQSCEEKINIDLHLIEPSDLALQHATYYIKNHPINKQYNIKIFPHKTTLNGLPAINKPVALTIHLFSNVLDFAYLDRFSLKSWKEMIMQQGGHHFCFAVSPAFLSGKIGFDQMKGLFFGSNLIVDQYNVDVQACSYSSYHRRMISRSHPSQLLALHFIF